MGSRWQGRHRSGHRCGCPARDHHPRRSPGTTRTGCRGARHNGSACRTSARTPRLSVGMPRERSVAATAALAGRESSSIRATRTALGTERSAVSPPATSGHQKARDAERDADTGIGVLAVAGELVVATARADRSELLVAGHAGLEHGAGVVVEAAGDAQIGDNVDAVSPGRAGDDLEQLVEALVEQRVLDTECAYGVDERSVRAADLGECEALCSPARR